ncbi:MAG: hypothetical protein IPM54_24290 [Polyangiaceae bacterium]|nr:hypothetical protein [Polyangiaceae bacterium]
MKPVTPFDAPKPKGPLDERSARLDDTAPLPTIEEPPPVEDVTPAPPVVEKPPMIGPIAVADETSVVKPSHLPNEGIVPPPEEAAPALPPIELTIEHVANDRR